MKTRKKKQGTERRHRNQYDSGILANHILTVLAIIFFVIVGLMVILVYLSSGWK